MEHFPQSCLFVRGILQLHYHEPEQFNEPAIELPVTYDVNILVWHKTMQMYAGRKLIFFSNQNGRCCFKFLESFQLPEHETAQLCVLTGQ